MKLKCGIFGGLKISRAMCVALGLLCIGTPVMAATVSNGCDKDDNNRIVPMLALCSTHAYNIGDIKNPSNASDRQLMRDVVALKSTVIMQQMYKQYEYLEATVQRLKTQLEREILTYKFQVAGAPSDASGGASSSSSGANGVTGAENCMIAGLSNDVMSCLLRNLDRITTAINNADIGAAKRQIDVDLDVLQGYDNLDKTLDANGKSENMDNHGALTLSQYFYNAKSTCEKAGTDRNKLTNCVNLMRVCINRNIEQLQRQNNNSNMGRYPY